MIPPGVSIARILILTAAVACLSFSGQGQQALDSVQRRNLTISAYADTYFAWNPGSDSKADNPFLVSSARQNSLALNLGFLKIDYRNKGFQLTLSPAIGTYMKANYAAEPDWARNILEANAGVRVSAKKDIWLHAGVFTSPFTNENPVSRDQDMYLRSLAPELVPYYISGLQLSGKVAEKVRLGLWIVNGWQVIADPNKGKSLVTQVAWDITPRLRLYHNSILGDERNPAAPELRTRFLNDMYVTWTMSDSFSGSACFDIGHQAVDNGAGATWWQFNTIVRKHLNQRFSLSFRTEYFHDPSGAAVTQLVPGPRFKVAGLGSGLHYRWGERSLIRLEGRMLRSSDPIFPDGTLNRDRETILALSWTSWL